MYVGCKGLIFSGIDFLGGIRLAFRVLFG